MADNIENPLLPENVDNILALYSPAELSNYRRLRMLDSRGIPTIPPGGKFNSQGIPISPTLNSMSPEEKQNAATADTFLKTGKAWKPTENPVIPTVPIEKSSSNLISPSYMNRQLNFSEMTSLAKQAGFDDKTAPLMAAIAMGESHGWTNAHNSKHPDDSYGITQINALAHGSVAKEAYNNPLRAMQLAYKVSDGGTNFRPWTVYTSGAYKKYLDGDVNVAAGSGQGLGSNANAGLTGNLPASLTLTENPDSAKQKLAEKISGNKLPSMSNSDGLSSLALLGLLGQYKVTPINYDPWKYVPKAADTQMYASKSKSESET